MNKKIIAIVAAVVVLAGGAAAYLLLRPSDSAESTESLSSAKQGDEEGIVAETASSLRSLFGGGKNQICTYSSEEDSGTVYTAGDKRLRVDYTSTNPDASSGSMIMTTEKSYFWDNSTKEGFSMPYQEPVATEAGNSSSDVSTSSDDSSDVDVDEEYKFSCRGWNVDSSLFTPPADVKFTDMSELMPQ